MIEGRLAAACLALQLVATPAVAQTGAVTGVVVARESAVPLPFSAIRVNGGGLAMSSDSGRFRFTNLQPGTAHLRVQRIGYFPLDVDVQIRADQTTDVRLELTHVPVRLSEIHVRGTVCTAPGRPRSNDSSLANVFQQLTFNAEQFRLFNSSYPFASMFARRFTRQYVLAARDSSGTPRLDSVEVVTRADAIAMNSETEWHYRHGEVIQRDFSRGILPTYGVAIPNLAVFADPEFVAWHCFWDGGDVTTARVRERRIDFAASGAIDSPDLDGSLFLDPETFVIRRSVISLSRGSRASSLYDSVTVETNFAEVVPGVAIIASTRGHSLLKRDEARDRSPEIMRACLEAVRDVETQRMTAIEFKDTSSSLIRIGVANVLYAASSGPATVRRLLYLTDLQNKEPILGAQVRDSASGISVITSKEGLLDLAWFPPSDTLTLFLDRPEYESTKIVIPNANEARMVPAQMKRGFSPYRDKRPPFAACK